MKQDMERKNSTLVKVTIVSGLLLILSMLPNLLKAQRLLIDDFEVGIKTGTTTPYIVSITTTQTSDPAGHSCCVTAVPSLIEVFLVEGDLVLREVGNGNSVPWLDFDPMRLDSNREFVSESRATVAGFGNILTVLSGNVTSDGITGTFSIGAGGGLPGGLPINHDFQIIAEGGLRLEHHFSSYLAFHAEVGVGFDFIDILEDEEKPEALFLVLQDDLNAPEADWWLLTLSGGEIRSYDPNTLSFQPGLRPTVQGPTTSIPAPVKFTDFSESQTEKITVFFGIDTRQNGVLDEDLLTGVGYTYWFN